MLPTSLLIPRHAYSLDCDRPLGRQSAGADPHEAYLRFDGQQQQEIVIAEDIDGPWLHQEALRINQNAKTLIYGLDRWSDADQNAGASCYEALDKKSGNGN